jgi:Ca2+-binding EF-hand superfamily protein
MSNQELIEQWERIQTKTFTNWVNSHLIKRGKKIESVLTDLSDGVMLLHLLEAISGDSVGKINEKPKMKIHNIENLNKALKFIAEHGVKLASIGSEAICDKDVKLTLGLIWTLILRFAIVGLSEEGLSAKEGLLLWCRRKTEPYDNVDVKDFTMSFQDGLAFCALIHRHRPDLIDYDSLSADDKLGNLNLAFDVAKEHLDVARLLDAEDIVNMPRPDERSIMTYVAQLYQVFSSLDKVEVAGRRIGKLADFAKMIFDLQHDYEERTKALKSKVTSKSQELEGAGLGDDYVTSKNLINEFRQYRKTEKREWVGEQEELQSLFNIIQAKLKTHKRPVYVPPQGLSVDDVEDDMNNLNAAESKRRTSLNAQLRAILDQLRADFAEKANAFADKLAGLKKAVSANADAELSERLSSAQSNQAQLAELGNDLPAIQAAEKACDDANIEENEKTDHTYDDLWFAHNLLTKTYNRNVDLLNNQIQASQTEDISPEQVEEFKETFKHFDQDQDEQLSKLEFKSCLSGLGVVELDFEGGDKRFESIFNKVAAGSDTVDFQKFLKYMISITKDEESPEQIEDSFNVLAGGKDHVTENDMKVGQLSAEQIAHLKSVLPEKDGISGGYDYKAYVQNLFNN